MRRLFDRLARRLGYLPTSAFDRQAASYAEAERISARQLAQADQGARSIEFSLRRATDRADVAERLADSYLTKLADAVQGRFPAPSADRLVKVTGQGEMLPTADLMYHRVAIMPRGAYLAIAVDQTMGDTLAADPKVFARSLVRRWAEELEPQVVAEFARLQRGQ